MTALAPRAPSFLPGWDDLPSQPHDEALRIDIARAEACSLSGWAPSAFDDALPKLDDGRRGGRLRAALRLLGLARGEWDAVVAEAVRVRVPREQAPFWAEWLRIAEAARSEAALRQRQMPEFAAWFGRVQKRIDEAEQGEREVPKRRAA